MSFKKMEKIRKQKNNSSFVILILLFFKFRNPGRSTFDHSIFCIPPKNFQCDFTNNIIIERFSIINNFLKFNNLEYKKKFNSTIWNINISQLKKLLNILGVQKDF